MVKITSQPLVLTGFHHVLVYLEPIHRKFLFTV